MFLSSPDNKVFEGVVVAPHVPRTEGGLYWGYSVRLASCLSTPPTLTEHVWQSHSASARRQIMCSAIQEQSIYHLLL